MEGGVKVGTKWKIYLEKLVNMKAQKYMHVFMYFLNFSTSFTPHYIIMVKGLLYKQSCLPTHATNGAC